MNDVDDALAERLAAEVRDAEGVVALYPTGSRVLGGSLPGLRGTRPPVRWYWIAVIVLGAAAVVALNVVQR